VIGAGRMEVPCRPTRFYGDGCYGMANAELVGQEALTRLRQLPTLGDLPQARTMKQKKRRRTYRAVLPLRDGSTEVLVKEHRWDPRRAPLVNALCLRRPVCAARMACRLAQAGFHTFQPVAAVRSRAKGPADRAWLVFRPLRGTSLQAWLKAGPPLEDAERMLRAVAREAARLHDAHFWHGDLRPQNILLLEAGREGEPGGPTEALGFIDVDRAGRRRWWLCMCAGLRQALDVRNLLFHLRGDCAVDARCAAIFRAQYYGARGFGALRRRLWNFILRFPRKSLTRRQRATTKPHIQKPPLSRNRLLVVLKRLLRSRHPDS